MILYGQSRIGIQCGKHEAEYEKNAIVYVNGEAEKQLTVKEVK